MKRFTLALLLAISTAFLIHADDKPAASPATSAAAPLNTVALVKLLQDAGARYYDQYHAWPPTPENYRVTATLLGDNADKIVFVEKAQLKLNANGEILDEWGTPLRFNLTQDTALPIEVYSAGKDKIFGNTDDIPKPQKPAP